MKTQEKQRRIDMLNLNLQENERKYRSGSISREQYDLRKRDAEKAISEIIASRRRK